MPTKPNISPNTTIENSTQNPEIPVLLPTILGVKKNNVSRLETATQYFSAIYTKHQLEQIFQNKQHGITSLIQPILFPSIALQLNTSFVHSDTHVIFYSDSALYRKKLYYSQENN